MDLPLATQYSGRLGVNVHVSGISDGVDLLKNQFPREKMGLVVNDQILIQEDSVSGHVLMAKKDYESRLSKKLANSRKSKAEEIDIIKICRENTFPKDWQPTMDVISDCDITQLKRGSVSSVDVPVDLQSIFLSFTSRGVKTGLYMDEAFVYLYPEVSTGKSKSKFNASQEASYREVCYCSAAKGNHLAAFRHSGDLDVCLNRKKYLVHGIKTSRKLILNEMKEGVVHVVYIASYMCKAPLEEMLDELPRMFFVNEKLKVMQQINLPIDELITNKDAYSFGIGGLIKVKDQLYYISPVSFPCFGRATIPIDPAHCSQVRTFEKELRDIFYQNLPSPASSSSFPVCSSLPVSSSLPVPVISSLPTPSFPPSSLSSSLPSCVPRREFSGMVIVHCSQDLVGRLLKEKDTMLPEKLDVLYVLASNNEIRYFTHRLSFIEYLETNSIPNSDAPCLTACYTTCIESSLVLDVKVVGVHPFPSWSEAVAAMQGMQRENVVIFVDTDVVRNVELFQSGYHKISGHLVLMTRRGNWNKIPMGSCSMLDTVSRVSVWDPDSRVPKRFIGYVTFPTDSARVLNTRKNLKIHRLRLSHHQFCFIDDVLSGIRQASIDSLVQDSSVCLEELIYQISLACHDEAELRQVITNMSKTIESEMDHIRNLHRRGTISGRAAAQSKKNIDAFFRLLKKCAPLRGVYDLSESSSAENLAKRAVIADNVRDVTSGAFHPMSPAGVSIFFDVTRCLTPAPVKMPLSMNPAVVEFGIKGEVAVETSLLDFCDTGLIVRQYAAQRDAFVFPMYDDVESVQSITAVDWSDLACRGLASNGLRIYMRQVISESLQISPASKDVTDALLKFLLDLARVVLRERTAVLTGGGEFYRKVNRRVFAFIMMLVASGNNADAKDCLWLAFHAQKEHHLRRILQHRQLFECLVLLLKNSDFVDKDQALSNFFDNFVSYVEEAKVKPVVSAWEKKSKQLAVKEEVRCARGLLESVEHILVTTGFKHLNFETIIDQSEHERYKHCVPPPGSLTERDDRNHRNLINYYHETLHLLGGPTGKLTLRKWRYSENSVEGKALKFVQSVVERKDFESFKDRVKGCCVGKLLFLIQLYFKKYNAKLAPRFVYHIKRLISMLVLKRPQSYPPSFFSSVSNCSAIPVVNHLLTQNRTSRRFDDDMDKFSNLFDKTVGSIVRATFVFNADYLSVSSTNTWLQELRENYRTCCPSPSQSPNDLNIVRSIRKLIESTVDIDHETQFVQLTNGRMLEAHPLVYLLLLMHLVEKYRRRGDTVKCKSYVRLVLKLSLSYFDAKPYTAPVRILQLKHLLAGSFEGIPSLDIPADITKEMGERSADRYQRKLRHSHVATYQPPKKKRGTEFEGIILTFPLAVKRWNEWNEENSASRPVPNDVRILKALMSVDDVDAIAEFNRSVLQSPALREKFSASVDGRQFPVLSL